MSGNDTPIYKKSWVLLIGAAVVLAVGIGAGVVLSGGTAADTPNAAPLAPVVEDTITTTTAPPTTTTTTQPPTTTTTYVPDGVTVGTPEEAERSHQDRLTKSFSGLVADAARDHYWDGLMTDYLGYTPPPKIHSDAEWLAQLFDAVAESNEECSQWNDAIELYLTELTPGRDDRPVGWSSDDAYYELVVSILAYSPGQNPPYPPWGGPAVGMLANCVDLSEVPVDVADLLTRVPITPERRDLFFERRIQAATEAFVDAYGGDVDDPMFRTSLYWGEESAIRGDALAASSEMEPLSCVRWVGMMFAGHGDPYSVEQIAAGIMAYSVGPGRMMLSYCGR